MKKFFQICFQILLFSTVDETIYIPTNSVKRVPFPTDPLQNLLADILKMTFLISLMLYLIVSLICNSLILRDDQHLCSFPRQTTSKTKPQNLLDGPWGGS